MKKLFKRVMDLFVKCGIIKPKDVLYIGGADVLPPPLQHDEELDLIKNIDREEARVMLIEHNLRLVVYIAKRFENTGIYIEDLISIGAIGLIKAINTFNADKNIKLATYATRCIENEILMYIRKNSSTKCEISFDEPLNTDWDGNQLLLSDVLGTDSESVMQPLEDDTDKQILLSEVSKLAPRERDIVEMRFGLNGKEGKTQKEVADILGISQSYISRIEKRVITKLRRNINKLI